MSVILKILIYATYLLNIKKAVHRTTNIPFKQYYCRKVEGYFDQTMVR